MKKYIILLLILSYVGAAAQTVPDTIKIKVNGGISQKQLTDSLNNLRNSSVQVGSKYPIYVVDPLYPVNDTTTGFHTLNLPELRYSFINRNIHTDTSLTDKKYVDSIMASLVGSGDVVSTVALMQSYSSTAKYLLLTDTLQGGVFVYSTDANTVDGGTVFAATGKGSGYWVRQYDKSKGVNVDWWGARTDVGINAAISAVGINGVLNFTPQKIYLLSNQLNPLSGQIWNGNGATLKRANDSIVTLTASVLATDSSFTVNSIPSSWQISGLYQFFSDSTNTNQNITTSSSVSITGTTVKLGGTIGKAWSSGTTYVRRVFSMIKSPQNVQFYRFNFDGNKANTSRNISWTANSTMLAYGYGNVVVDHCTFINIPNENIVGQGLIVTYNKADSLNGSFVHLTAEADRLPVYSPTLISGNITHNTSQVNTGHSEGAITNSFTPGFVTITDNRFYNNGTYSGVFGYIQSDSDAADGAYRDVVIANNYAEGFSKIFYYISILPSLNRNGHIFINGNTFNNCGINDWMPYKDSIDKYTDSILIGNNMLVGGTVWKVPIQKSDSLQRYLINNATGTPQNAFLNISRSATIGDTLSVGNIPVGAITDSAVTTKNKSIRKIAFSDLGYMPIAGGQFTGNVSFSNNKILYGRLVDFTSVSMLQIDNTNAMNYGNMAIPYSYFYTQNDFTFYNNPSVLKRFTIKGNGHILMGNISDNGTDWLQVAGTINSLGNSIIGKTEAATDSSNKTASTAFVKNRIIGSTATLVGGTVTVSSTAVTASSKIFVTVNTPGGTQGFLSVPTASIVAGASFVINSSSASETSTVNWMIVN